MATTAVVSITHLLVLLGNNGCLICMSKKLLTALVCSASDMEQFGAIFVCLSINAIYTEVAHQQRGATTHEH